MKALVIIPTYNEAANIAAVIPQVLAAATCLEVLVVDDNSPDGTGRIVDQLAVSNPRIHVLHRPAKLGLGTAYIAGFQYAVNRKYDFVLEMDADLSHDPKCLPDFLSAMNSADVVIGSRYLNGVNVVNWPMHRLLLSFLANWYARLITGLPLRDLTSGFKCFRCAVLEAVDLSRVTSEGYAFQIEMNYLCWRRKFTIREIPIVFTDRTQGKTKMDRRVIFEAVWIVWQLKLLSWLGRI
ncbi:MAG: dolichyl-phosphate beta-D-mannosyltransferase [Deltaproteobacteria bacterium RIFOXYD12_FULL_57_12]|nr:MAG: dolichyl-phosphate beta-D-mannosyltransferase [Deltaproteobacteria bacterium RIFOXYD12_FULL_57_12]